MITFGMIGGLNAQTCLTLSSARVNPDGTGTLNLLLSSSGPLPSTLQWTFRYSGSTIGILVVDDGAALSAAAKTAMCARDTNALTCIVAGANSNKIQNGMVAIVTVALLPGADTATIRVDNTIGAATDGYLISINSEDGSLAPNNGSSLPRMNLPPKQSGDKKRCAAP